MSREGVKEAAQRLLEDPQFAAAVLADPEDSLVVMDLTDEEHDRVHDALSADVAAAGAEVSGFVFTGTIPMPNVAQLFIYASQNPDPTAGNADQTSFDLGPQDPH